MAGSSSRFCGLDFGTSNSTLGRFIAGEAALVPLEGDATTLPSAIFFDFAAARPVFGRAAMAAYSSGRDGRLMRALKSVLGTSLIDQETQLDRRRIGFRAVLALLLAEIKARAEAAGGEALESVVHGRPVYFVDGDTAADAQAETILAEIAQSVGFRHISFQYEPIAAALAYERQLAAEETAIIADIGGGTSDFTIIRLGPDRRDRPDRMADILANDGLRLGGTDFDQRLSLKGLMPHLGYQSPMRRAGLLAPNGYFADLATWSKINFLYTGAVRAELAQILRESAAPSLIQRLITVIAEQNGHRLAMTAESAKITLSATESLDLPLDWIEDGLQIHLDAAIFAAATGGLAQRIGERIGHCLTLAQLRPDQIDAVFLTGGSTLLPPVRAAILQRLPDARVIDGDRFGSVGLGLTLEAARRYR